MVSEKVQQLNALVLSVTELQGEARGDKSMQYNLAKTSVEFNTALTPAQKAAFRPAVVAYHEVIRKQLDQRQALLGSLEEMVQEQQTALTQCKSELESVEALKATLPEESKLEGAAVAPASIESTPASMPAATEDAENETSTTEVVAKLEAAVDNGDAAKLLASIMSVLPSIKVSSCHWKGGRVTTIGLELWLPFVTHSQARLKHQVMNLMILPKQEQKNPHRRKQDWSRLPI